MDHGAREIGTLLNQRLRGGEISVPPYPAVALELQRLGEIGAGLVEVAAVVATDPALAASVLRRASSAAARSKNPPTTLAAAIWRLGLDELTRVVLALGLGATATAAGPLADLRRDQWRRSLLAALFCRELASRRGVSSDEAFLAGLLHDFGGVVALVILESAGMLPTLPATTWRRMIDEVHLDVGAIVADRWQLPPAIAEVIAYHHRPSDCARIHRPLVQLVAVVDQILTILDRGPTGGIDALVEVAGLDHDERYRIGALMPVVGEQMARFESEPARGATPSSVEHTDALLAAGWAVDFEITDGNRAQYRASVLAPDGLGMRSQTPLEVGWLVELAFCVGAEPLSMLANIRSCKRLPSGEYMIAAQPFGLGGAATAIWRALVATTRGSAEPAVADLAVADLAVADQAAAEVS